MSPNVKTLYWCEGVFRPVAVVKGRLPSGTRRFLWASSIQGCRVPPNASRSANRVQTRVWFLRPEGEFLRPVFDSGTHGFIGLYARWEGGPPSPARVRLGRLLLTPSANSETLEQYSQYLWDVGPIACELLGTQDCARMIRELKELLSANKLAISYEVSCVYPASEPSTLAVL
jgi:hypothetical protein